MALTAGTRLGPYEIQSPLGAGGMGEVYRALDTVLRYGIEIGEGLEMAHRAGIVHRDLKRGNIMLTKTGVKLMDFGLAKSSPASASAAASWSLTLASPAANSPLTEKGMIVGTFQYMSPE